MMRPSIVCGTVLALAGACSAFIDTSGLTSTNVANDGDAQPIQPGADAGTAPDGAGDGEAGCSYLYCNDFESEGDLDDWYDENIVANIGHTAVHSGSGALELTRAGSSSGQFRYRGATRPPRHFFVRTFVRMKDIGGAFLYFGREDYAAAMQLYVGGDDAFHIGQYSDGDDVYTAISPTLDEWHCVEMEVDLDQSVARAWFDDDGPHTISLVTVAGFDTLALVVSAPGMSNTGFDALAFDDRRIGCSGAPPAP